MATQQQISELHEQARELVTNLEELHRQVESYRTAKDELQKASSELVALVESTKQLSERSHQIIKAVNELGSAGVLELLSNLEEGIQTIRKNIQDSKAAIEEWLDGLDKSLQRASRKQTIVFAAGFGLVIILQIVLFVLARS